MGIFVFFKKNVIFFIFYDIMKSTDIVKEAGFMASKSKKKKNASWILPIFAAICGIVAFFLIFAEAIKFEFIGTKPFTGLQIAFGYKLNNIEVFEFNIGIFLGYLFPLLGAAIAVIGKGKKIASVLASALMLVGGILVFCTIPLLGKETDVISLMPASICSGILSILGACTEGLTIVKK